MDKRYQAAIEWIAENDNPGSKDGFEEILMYLTVAMVADLFIKTLPAVARDVVIARKAKGYL